MDILAMSFCVKSSHSHLSVSLKCQHLLGFEEEEQASAFIPPALTPNQSFQLRDLPGSQLHLLCQALCNPYCKIKDLKLIFCHLTASCGRDLSLVLETNQYLIDLEFVKHTPEDSEVKLLCEGLKQPNCILQTLRLFVSFLPESSEAVCKYLASVLICNPNLTELDLSKNPLGDTGVKYLCEGLRHSNCKVEKLELWTCNLTRECCQDLCNALYANEHLRDLDPSDNALGDEGMQVLCEGLKQPSCKLQTLCIDMDHLHEETFREIEALKNMYGRIYTQLVNGS
ncbi:NACHT, LRR and PYD domains-containing protein 12-like isoform X1 [Pteropus medius]|uniref:NACHT, LRR and PYD domains-containing protein 12-like isoform X1 n=3 Tax=Pteropus vampyrus TaxID=132908 RepID=UPI00196B70A6|nr:NACHT, LRR and PYD domains-containing protein 12-like isoform X1 [Pteropus giganteus]XP_039735653.1 NACHT, LRR and PYD domains-containing protein 12-like isoform X1 [Pteropus giganteus]